MEAFYSPRCLIVWLGVFVQSQLILSQGNVGFSNGFKIKFLCGNSYHISQFPLNWNSATDSCDENGLKLIALDSKFKQDCLAKYFKEVDQLYEFWTSGSDKIEEERFRWESTKDFFSGNSFSSWAPRQPDNKGGREHSILVKFNDGENGKAQWYDESGLLEYNFICEE